MGGYIASLHFSEQNLNAPTMSNEEDIDWDAMEADMDAREARGEAVGEDIDMFAPPPAPFNLFPASSVFSPASFALSPRLVKSTSKSLTSSSPKAKESSSDPQK